MTKTSKQTTSPYWRERELAEIAQKQARGATLAGEMERLYAYHVKAVETEIEGFLQRYADKEKLDLAEAKKRVAEFDVMAFEEKAKRYVAEKNFSSTANRELRLYNLKMKVSRAELLQYQLDLEMVALAEGERQLTEKFLNQAYVEELKRQAGLLGHGVPSPERIGQLAQASINANFYGAKWSERIWERQSELRKILQEDIEGMLFKGQNPVRLIPRLRKEFDVSRYEAKRLAVTEMARVSTEAQRQAFVEYGYEQYEFIAEPSACERCSSLDGEVFAVKDMRIGENASPMHPNCHCSVGAVGESDKIVEKASSEEYNQGMVSLDMMAKSKRFTANSKNGTAITAKTKKYEGISFDVWLENDTKNSRDTLSLLLSELEKRGNDSLPTFVILTQKKLPGLAAYDYTQDVMFISNALYSDKAVEDILSSGYFASRTFEDLLRHELTHKTHWDRAKTLYNFNPKRYNNLMEAKSYLDSDLLSYVKRQQSQNFLYVSTEVSENAAVALLDGNINELVADVNVRLDQVQDVTLVDKVKGVLGYD